ncbi:hypothetical protein K435DRAFT_802434 [Dendrothele bispora CBS 962.96]|uniref:Uncharacterized protein n=1 Tax=Dendrothele bispora (strain CBS 962.96) TaxID=1314807 RepID=A0A4S8LMA5_DENBC|nr:hypothetical protein K435DRAFT_802434 [Dendrothele bispora CBS 962.96]
MKSTLLSHTRLPGQSSRNTHSRQTLEARIADYDLLCDGMQSELEETRGKLTKSEKDFRELHKKYESNLTQLDLLESEVHKRTMLLEQAKETYRSLQKQYQEQCATAEQYRINLRARDDTIQRLRDIVESTELERNSSRNSQHTLENRICQLEHQLSFSQEMYAELDQKKKENLLLKETIKHMEMEFEEMRTSIINSPLSSPSLETAFEVPNYKPLSLEILALSNSVEKDESVGDEKNKIKTETDVEDFATTASSERNASPFSPPSDYPSAYDDKGDMKWRVCAEEIVRWSQNGGTKDTQNNALAEHELKAVEEALQTLCANIESKSNIEEMSSSRRFNTAPDPTSRSTLDRFSCPHCEGKSSVGKDAPLSATLIPDKKHRALIVSLLSLIGLVISLGPNLWTQPNIPGGATVYDRKAWSSFNNLEPTGEGLSVGAAGAKDEPVEFVDLSDTSLVLKEKD